MLASKNVRNQVPHSEEGGITALYVSSPRCIFPGTGNVENGLAQEKRIEHEVQEGDNVHPERIVTDVLVKQRQYPTNLCVDTEQAECGIYEHPFDFVTTKNVQIEYCVDEDGDAAVHIQKCHARALLPIRHNEAGTPKHKHVGEKEWIDCVPTNLMARAIGPAVDRDVALEFHL